MGAPGTSYWTGSVLVYNTSSRGMSVYVDDDTRPVSFGSYLGNMVLSVFIYLFIYYSNCKMEAAV